MPPGGVQSGDDYQSIEGQHDKGVDEHADHGYHALVVGILHVGLGVSVGGGTHAGLVGKQAALGALADGFLQRVTEAAADDGLGLKGILEDHSEGGGDILNADDQYGQRAQQEDSGHDRDDLLGDGGQTLHAAHKDEAADDNQYHAHDPGGNAEGGLEGGADGVGLDHTAHKAQSQNDSYRKESGQELTKSTLKGSGDIVNGAAVEVAVLIGDAGLDGQSSLGVDGGHAEERDDPHPEDGAGTAGQNGAGSAYDVAGAHLGGDGSGQSLEGTHTLLLPSATQRHISEYLLHALAEAAYLNKAGADGIEKTHADEQEDQNIAGQVGVDIDHNRIKCGLQGLQCFRHRFLPLKYPEQKRPWKLPRSMMGRKQTHAEKTAGRFVRLCPFA